MRKIKEYPLNGKLKESELKSIPKEHLVMLLTIIDTARKEIKEQISRAHAKKRKRGITIDHEWLNRAKNSLETKKLHREMIQKELGCKKQILASVNRRKNSAA